MTSISIQIPAETRKTSSLRPLLKEFLTIGYKLELQCNYIQTLSN